jgi:F-type H+-transporting ATPase subunit b
LSGCCLFALLAIPVRAQQSTEPREKGPKYQATIGQKGGAGHAEQGKEGGGKGPEYEATIETPKGERERSFDLSREDDQRELFDLLRKGEIQQLVGESPPDIFGLRWDLGLWSLVVFLLLLFILNRVAWKPMLEGLRKREETIRGAVEQAHQAREDAKRLQSQFQEEMAHAQDKVRDIMDGARRDAQRTTDEMVTKARADIQSERDRLHREIETARDQALQEIWTQTAQLATLVSAKTIGRELSPDDHRRFVDEAIADLRRSGGDARHGTASSHA